MTYDQVKKGQEPEATKKTEGGLTQEEAWKITAIRYGSWGIGFAAGGITGMLLKRGVWGCIGYAFLGAVLGSGIGLLATIPTVSGEKKEE